MMKEIPELPLSLTPQKKLGMLKQDSTPAPIPGATWYEGYCSGDGLLYRFRKGALSAARFLTADTLLDGTHLATFLLILQEGENGPIFELSYGLLNQCSARIRMPLEAVNQNRWRFDREGAWLKPRCQGQRVDLRKVDRMRIEIERKSDRPVRWCMTKFIATADEPPRLEKLILPKGPILDEFGQSTLHEWSGKSRSREVITRRLQAQLSVAPTHKLPEGFSRWGGWKVKRFKASGFFRTEKSDGRWWLVDPDGYAFWSSGLDCVRVDIEGEYKGIETALTWMPDPQSEFSPVYTQHGSLKIVNYLASNLIHAFGPEHWYEKWTEITLAELRRLGFNTIANWSDWKIAQQAGVPYVRPLEATYTNLPQVYRDFPDVFHPDFEKVAATYAEQLRETSNDPAFIGYFMMNEPTWGFAQETPAAGMLYNTPSCHAREALSRYLSEKYATEKDLSTAWGIKTSFKAITEGEWRQSLTPSAQADLADFSAIMVKRFFGELSKACRIVDPHHLNLGIRYYTIPPAWAVEGMRYFDVFSMNCYRKRLPAEEMARVHKLLGLPIMIGEWHFGALDVGLPASGIGHVPDQEGRGKAFRFYLEDAAEKPWCVGVHYFILYDQSAIGRFDGENYNIGFLDVCNRPYELLAKAARTSHERLYQVAAGELEPFKDAPEYLPMLFM